jgi:hypothetical protein
MMPIVCCTFDLDFTDHTDESAIDELEYAFPELLAVLENFPSIKTTWFVRVDSQMEARFGCAEFAFRHHGNALHSLLAAGHELGWHHHAYRAAGGRWMPEQDETALLRQLRRYGEQARGLGMRIARSGWAQHTNATMRELSALGFQLDSSAIPRPRYPWEMTALRDWSTTGQDPYFPSARDYRIAGEPALDVLEFPISTVPLPRETDTIPGVKRYISLAYEQRQFSEALGRCPNRWVVLVTHAYEILERNSRKCVSAPALDRLSCNLQHLHAVYGGSVTLREAVTRFPKEAR